jgi:hypothetical protein
MSLSEFTDVHVCSYECYVRLLEIAPHYYDLSNFPKCEAKYELEVAMKRLYKM